MDTETFSLEEIRRELARLGYQSLSKQTLLKFQEDLAELAREEKAKSMTRMIHPCRSSSSMNASIYLDANQTRRFLPQQQSNLDFTVNEFRVVEFD